MIREAIARAAEGETLSADQAEQVMGEMMDGTATAAQMAAYLTALRVRGETVEELTGSARAMRARCVKVTPRRAGCIDTCGTGGDHSGSFNLSSAAALVVAAAGVPVAKHGNRAVSGRCGSADFYEALGLVIDASPARVAECIDEIGFGFCFAPACHPAMKSVAGVRKELGIRTLFNLLGPVCNPAHVRRQLIGVFSPVWIEPIARVLGALGCERVLVVHGEGLDEIAPWGRTVAGWYENGVVRRMEITPNDGGTPEVRREDIAGGDGPANAARFEALLRGRRDPLAHAVLLTAGAAIWVSGTAGSLKEGVSLARGALESGAVARLLERLREWSNRQHP